MSLDLYIGPFSRFWARDFLTPTQKWAASHAISSKVVSAAGAIARPMPTRAVVPAALAFQAHVLRLHATAPADPAWDESERAFHDSVPLGWGAYNALRLAAAYFEVPDLTRPDTVPQDLRADAALETVRANIASSRFPDIHGAASAWIPCSLHTTAKAPTPTGQTVSVGSVSRLAAQLADLSAMLWNRPLQQLDDAWVHAAAAGPPIEHAARDAAHRFVRAIETAVKHRTPIMLDG